jgi:hypothetical protein
MLQPITEKSYLVELNLGTVAVQKQINFQFIPQLEGSLIYGIQSFSSTELSVSPNGSTVVSAVGLADLTVTFVVGDMQDVFLLPVADLNSPLIQGFIRMFNNKKLNLTKSFVTIQSVATVANNESILFNFLYRKA